MRSLLAVIFLAHFPTLVALSAAAFAFVKIFNPVAVGLGRVKFSNTRRTELRFALTTEGCRRRRPAAAPDQLEISERHDRN